MLIDGTHLSESLRWETSQALALVSPKRLCIAVHGAQSKTSELSTGATLISYEIGVHDRQEMGILQGIWLSALDKYPSFQLYENHDFYGLKIFHNDRVNQKEINAVYEFFHSAGLSTGLALDKAATDGSTRYEVYLPVREELRESPATTRFLQALSDRLSCSVFERRPVFLPLCAQMLSAKNTVRSSAPLRCR